ncbi:MAG: MotE family protein [Rhodospirillales bacterium]
MKRLLPRIRFLPLTIFAATLMLTVKIGDIWDGFDGLMKGTIQVADALAQAGAQPGAKPAAAPGATAQKPAAKPGAKEAAKDAAKPGAKEAAKDAAKPGAKDAAKDAAKPGAKDTAAEATPAAPAQPQPSKLVTEDPTLLTQAEIDLLQHLAERRRVIESREQELQIRTGLLTAAEARIDKKIEELKVLRETINGLIKTFDAQQDAKLLSLVKIYENMKPKEAAKIFEDMEMDILLEVAERMKERKLSPIMAKMNPEKAREMTVELARLRQLPRGGGQVGG